MIDTIVKINSSVVTITGNPVVERNIKEELDTGSIVIVSTKAERYEMYDKVDITTPYNDEEQYLIQGDIIVQNNATEYEHTISLFENIAYFNTIYPADRSFKVIGQTLEDVLNAYERELSAYHNITITWTTIPQAVLDETIPFKEFAGLNLSSILLSLFRKIWAVPKVNRIGSDWDIYPLYHNAKNNSIPSESISKMSQQNNVDYATKVKSQLKNAVNERTEGETTWFPSAGGYVLPRSSSLEKIESKLRYEVDSNIVSMLKVEAVDISYVVDYTDGRPDDVYTNVAVDITSQVVQDETWDLLPVTTDTAAVDIMRTNNAKNNIRFKVGQPYITNLFELSDDGIIFKVTTKYLINAINRALYVLTGIPTSEGLAIVTSPLVTDEFKLRFKYNRQRNIDLIHNRKTKGVMNDITTIHQQRDASVEVNEYKKNLKIYSNRMGNNEFSKTKMFIYPDEPYELFDYTDNNTIVTRVQNTYHNLFVYCEYEESVSFSNIEAEYALMRRSDPYTINTKAVTTNIIVQEYIEFSLTDRTLETKLSSDARRLLLGQFEAVTLGLNKVAVGVFKPVLTSWNSLYSIHMPVEASGDGNLITVHVQFPHQTIAGKTYYDLETDTYEDYLNPLPYTDTTTANKEGTLANYELYYTPDVVFEDAGQYPLILSETLYLADAYTTAGISEPIDLDTAASFAQTLQISFIADEDIYVGNAMARSNYFVKDQATTTTPVVYSSPKPYGQYDQIPRTTAIDGFNDTVITATYNYSYTNGTITLTPSVAVDYYSIVKDGEILLAINRRIEAGATVIIHINHINDAIYVVMVNAVMTAPTASSSMTYLLALNKVVNAESSISSGASMTYDLALNIATDSTSSVVGSASMTYSMIHNTAVGISSSASVSASMTYSLILNYSLNATNTVSASASMTYDKALNEDLNVSSSVSVSASMTYSTEVFEWIETTEQTPTGTTCNQSSDIGNIKVESELECAYNETSNYSSTTNETTTIPACSAGATYTLCFFDKNAGIWLCTDYAATTSEVDVYYECQLN